ncbi:unnamed protein product, partial [Prunus brigantina]
NLGKRIGSRAGHGGPSPEPVGCRWTARAAPAARAGRRVPAGGRTGSVPSGTFPGRRTAASELATHPTLCIFTCLPCHALGLPCLALALACLGFGLPCLGLALALPCLAMSACLRLGMPCVGIALLCVALACRALACLGLGNGIAPIKLFRESEAIGSLARHGLGLALACAFRESEAIGSLAWRG